MKMRIVNIRAREYEKLGENEKGLSIELSPYDKPRAIEARFDEAAGVLHIDFKYLDQEASVSKRLNDKVNMKVGRYSGKILGFEVNVVKYAFQEVVLRVVKEVDRMIPQLQRYNERANYQFIKDQLDLNRDRLTELAAG